MIVLDDEGGVEVIPANVDRIGFLAVLYNVISGRQMSPRSQLTIEGETWMFHDLDD
jgi:hypothetical protein